MNRPRVSTFAATELARWLLLATPLLMVLDYGFGWNVRVAMLDAGRGWYYGVLLGLAGVVWIGPRWWPLAALAEATINIAGLIIGSWLQLFEAREALATGPAVTAPFDLPWLINFVLVGSILVAQFQARLQALFRRA